MTPRPNPRRAEVQATLWSVLVRSFGGASGAWQLFPEVEIRNEAAASRLIPDIAGWEKSRGLIDRDENPVVVAPAWAAEILSPTTEAFDRGEKLAAYGLMGVAWVWLVDVKKRRIEVYENDAGKLVHRETREAGDRLDAPPFEGLEAQVGVLFAP
jgi:Uma2 family endonuclease